MVLFLPLVLLTLLQPEVTWAQFTLDGRWAAEALPADAWQVMSRSIEPGQGSGPPLPGGYRTRFGAQYDASCLEIIGAAWNQPNQRPVIEGRLNGILEQAVTYMEACRQRYPELGSYIREWMGSLHRHRFSCGSQSSRETGYNAINDYSDHTTFSRDIFMGIYTTGSRSTSADGVQRYAASPENVVTVMHEILHSTDVNNRFDHGEIQDVSPQGCRMDVSFDRVSVIDSLCSGNRLHASKEAARAIFLQRITSCGLENGCMTAFTAASNNEPALFGPATSDLGPAAARSLCQRIQDDGLCLRERNRLGPLLTRELVIQTQGYRHLRRQLEERIQAQVPRSNNEIPTGLIDFVPGFRSSLERLLSRSGCARSVLRRGSSGSYFLTPYAMAQASARMEAYTDLFDQNSMARFLRPQHLPAFGHLDTALNLISLQGGHTQCASPHDISEVTSLLEIFREDVHRDPSEFNSVYMRDIFRLVKGFPADFLDLADNISTSKTHSVRRTLAPLLGADLYEELVDFGRQFQRFNTRSPWFDCVAAGLSPYRTVQGAQATLRALLQPLAPACQ